MRQTTISIAAPLPRGVFPPLSYPSIRNVYYYVPLTSQSPNDIAWLGNPPNPPNLGREGEGQVVKMVPFKSLCIGFLLAPHGDQSAISNVFYTTQHRRRRTDKRILID
jgi:hypothetical protein